MPTIITRAAGSAQGYGFGNAVSSAVSDPNFEYVSMLLSGDGTNAAQNNTFLDSSSNALSVTRYGNLTQGSLSPYGPNWSNYFEGANDYIQFADSSAWDFGSGDFTVELWVYTQAVPSLTLFIGQNTGTESTSSWDVRFDGTNASAYVFSSGSSYGVSQAMSQNTWNHVAFVRNSGTLRLYVNGTSTSSASANVTNNNATIPLTLGGAPTAGGYYLNGFLSNVRIVKGTAVYTSNFTPSTTPLTAIANTQLLTCQSSRFVDNSANALSATKTGDVFIQRFSPFNPTASYSKTSIGGSAYFDGSGDYLITSSSASGLNFGTGDFTIEFFINSLQTNRCDPLGQDSSYGATGWWGFIFNLTASGQMAWYENTNSRISASNTNWNNGGWNHVALTRSGNSVKMFLNGVQVGSTYTTSFSYGSSNIGVISGILSEDKSSGPFNGYLSDVRIIKGTALYTSNFTPPSAPLTAVSNTQLLLSMTNAGIYDSAMISNGETVGTAQISTSVSKFGGGSIRFDSGVNAIYSPLQPTLKILSNENFTIECWAYITTFGSVNTIYSTGSVNEYLAVRSSGTVVEWGTIAGGTPTFAFTFATNTWYHIALVRSGGNTVKCYVNGTQVGSTITYTGDILTATPLRVGCYSTGSNSLYGYMDDFRITKGLARYTSNFTPPTTAFPTF